MFHMVVKYDRPADTEAFLEHYRSSHAVKATRMPGLRNYTWGVVETLDGSEPEAYLVASLSFDSKDDLVSSMGSHEGQEAAADMEALPHNGYSIYTYQDA